MKKRGIYFDANSTTPMLEEVWEAMRPYALENFGNPASSHGAGRAARKALEDSREEIAALLGAFPDEVLFTSGATEGNNQAILATPTGGILVSSIEHPSVLEPVKALEKKGSRIVWMDVHPGGKVILPKALPNDVHLFLLMLVNHETGVGQPVEELGALAEGKGWFHCDAAQAAGKMRIDFHRLRAASLALSAHKFNGPKGAGLLLIRKGKTGTPLFFGGHQQKGLRPGTEATDLAVGTTTALRIAMKELSHRKEKVRALRNLFLNIVQSELPQVYLNGEENPDMPGTINLSFPGLRGDIFLMRLDLEAVCCSTGSACSSGSLLPSPVLQAMGQTPDQARSAMRFSLGHFLTEEETAEGARRVASTAKTLFQSAASGSS